MGLAHRLLHEDEELLAELRPHPVVVVPPILVTLAAVAAAVEVALRFPRAPADVAWVLLAMVLVPALWATARIVRWRSVRVVMTTSRLLYRRGVLSRDVAQLRLQRVAEVQCTQTLFGRLVGCGSIVLDIVGGDGPLVVEDVPRPRALQRLVTAQLDRLDVPMFARGAQDPFAATGSWGTGPPPAVPVGRGGRRRPQETPPRGTAAVGGGAAPAPTSVSGQLIELDELRRRGILTDAEFAAKKAQLLERL